MELGIALAIPLLQNLILFINQSDIRRCGGDSVISSPDLFYWCSYFMSLTIVIWMNILVSLKIFWVDTSNWAIIMIPILTFIMYVPWIISTILYIVDVN